MMPSKTFSCAVGALAASVLSGAPRITETSHLGRSHYKVETETATYFYDPVAGGFSSIYDPSGADWIAYSDPAKAPYPEGAGYAFRGLPNFVHKGEDGGAGHPGFSKCSSVIVSKNRIRTASMSGKWQWSWAFYEGYAEVALEMVDPDRAYWFLYEGPVGGQWDPAKIRWGSDTGGPNSETYDYFKGETLLSSFKWLYFSSESSGSSFWIAQERSDDALDFYSILGNAPDGLSSKDGMVVAGFGRADNAVPLLTGYNRFYIGMHGRAIRSSSDHAELSSKIETILEWNTNKRNETK